MKRDQDIFEKIEKYLNGELRSEELENFEEQLNEQPDLMREVELHRSLHLEMKDVDALEFRKKIIQIGKDQKNHKGRFFSWKVAAVLLVLISLSAFFVIQTRSGDSELFDTYYSPYPIEDAIRGDFTTDWDLVLQNYSNEEYEKVALKLRALILKHPENEVLNLYLGNSYLNTNQEKQAIRVFENITKESKYYESARWYLALSQIKLNNVQQAFDHLNWIITYDGLHKKKAVDLLHQLKIENPNDF